MTDQRGEVVDNWRKMRDLLIVHFLNNFHFFHIAFGKGFRCRFLILLQCGKSIEWYGRGSM